jgi:hypothetical protein
MTVYGLGTPLKLNNKLSPEDQARVNLISHAIL